MTCSGRCTAQTRNGCTFVLKPASDAPASSMAIFGLLDRIPALPHGVANGVVGEGGVVGEALATDTRVDKISFTGSSEVGRRLMELGARTFKRVSLEDAGFLDVSPDGNHIVYLDRSQLRLIPAVGGPAVTLLEHKNILMAPRFSRDGRDVYVSSQDPDRKTATLFRVPVSGGAATTALTAPYDNRSWSIVANPVHDRVIVSTSTNTSILTVAGDTVAVMPRIPEPWRISANFSRDGRRYGRSRRQAVSASRLRRSGNDASQVRV